MHFPLRSRLSLVRLGLAAIAIAATTGCGSSVGPTGPTAAKNIYTVKPAGSDANEADSVLTFSATATGTTTPTSTLALPLGFIAYSLASGPSGDLYIGGGVYQGSAEVLRYAPNATGSATPTVTLTGGQGSFDFPTLLAVSPQGQLSVADDLGYIYTYPLTLTTGTLPSSSLSYVADHDGYTMGLGVDGTGSIYVSDTQNGVIDVFAPTASGPAAPTRTITGASGNSFAFLLALAVDSAGNVAVNNYNQTDDPYDMVSGTPAHRFLHPESAASPQNRLHRLHPHTDPSPASTSIFVFAAGASGNATPTRTLSGTTTNINEPDGIAIDALSNLYYFDFAAGMPVIMSFPSSATGNVAPTTSFPTSAAFVGTYQNIAVY